MKTPHIDKLQRICYANAYRRGFWRGDGYSHRQAIEHAHSELDEFEAAILNGDKVNQAEEAGDVILCVLSTLHTLGIKASDAVNAAVSKELLKESYDGNA